MSFRPKNLLIVTHHYPPHVTGVGFAAQSQAKRLAAMGHTVTVITSRTDDQEKSAYADGVNVVRIGALNFTEKWGVPFPVFAPSLIAALWRHARNADVVHVHDSFYISSFCAAAIAWMRKKPLILTQHVAMIAHPSRIVVAIERIVYATTGALIFRLSDKILTYNKRVQEFLLGRGVDAAKLETLINGVDTQLFHPASAEEKTRLRAKLGIDPAKKVILFVGRFVPKKGFDKVLTIRSTDYQIVCAGGKAPRKGLDDVIFLGQLDQKALAEVYQAADIFLLPSEGEGFPLSIQEAMASGVPIISRDDHGYDIYGFDKELARFLDDPTEAVLRQAVAEAAHDPAKLAAMAAYSRSYAEEHFSWPVVISRLDGMYEALLAPSRRKRIAIISDAAYPFNKGGKEKRIHEITTRLAAMGHDVTIYCMKWWEGGPIVVKEGVTFRAISAHHDLYAGSRRSISQAIFYALACFKLLGRKFDVIDVDHMPQLVIFTAKIVCFLKGKRMIVTWHEVWGRDYWKQYLGPVAGEIGYLVEKMSAHLPDLIIAVSESTAERLKALLGTKSRIEVASNGVSLATMGDNVKPEIPSDLLFVGRLLSNKNVDMVVRAAAIVKQEKPDLRVLILGEGPEKENLKALAESLGISDNVTFIGFLDDNSRVYGMMKASKVFVFPSTREGFGIVALEANACGLPVITIDVEQNATRGLIKEGQNGMLTKLDEKEIARAASTLLATRKEPVFYRSYAEKYDWDAIVKEIDYIYTHE